MNTTKVGNRVQSEQGASGMVLKIETVRGLNDGTTMVKGRWDNGHEG